MQAVNRRPGLLHDPWSPGGHGPQRRGSITCVRPGRQPKPPRVDTLASRAPPLHRRFKKGKATSSSRRCLFVWLRGPRREIVDSSRLRVSRGRRPLPLSERGVVRVRAVGRERMRLTGPASLTRWVPAYLRLLAPLPLISLPVSAAAQTRREQRASAAQRPPPLELAPPFNSGGCHAEDVAARGTGWAAMAGGAAATETSGCVARNENDGGGRGAAGRFGKLVGAVGQRKPSKCGVCGVVVASSADVESLQSIRRVLLSVVRSGGAQGDLME